MIADTDWARFAADRLDAENILKPLNREALFDALTAASITAVVVEFDGCGDEGQIESLLFYRDETEMPAPQDTVSLIVLADRSMDRILNTVSIPDAVEGVVYDLLDTSHGGWQDGNGAYGDFRFEVGIRAIALSVNARFTDSENFQYAF